MESSRTSLALRTYFEVLDLGLEASSPQKLPCPRLEDSISLFFEPLKFCWKAPETSQKICEDLFLFSLRGNRLKKNFWRPFSPEKFFWRPFFEITWKKNWKPFFWENTCAYVLGLERVCPWPWSRNFFVSLALSLVFSASPLLINSQLIRLGDRWFI